MSLERSTLITQHTRRARWHRHPAPTSHRMPTNSQFKKGQAIIWLAKRSKSGEARFKVHGRVVKQTSKRITIRVLRGDGVVCLRSVASKYLLPDSYRTAKF